MRESQNIDTTIWEQVGENNMDKLNQTHLGLLNQGKKSAGIIKILGIGILILALLYGVIFKNNQKSAQSKESSSNFKRYFERWLNYLQSHRNKPTNESEKSSSSEEE